MAGAFSKLEEVKLGCPLPIGVLISIFSGQLLGKSISIGFRCNLSNVIQGIEPRQVYQHCIVDPDHEDWQQIALRVKQYRPAQISAPFSRLISCL